MSGTIRKKCYHPYHKQSTFSRRQTLKEFRRNNDKVVRNIMRGVKDPDDVPFEKDPATEG